MNRRVPPTARPLPRSIQGGFTLVEVMVTVLIIALLSAIALPVLSKGMKDRRTRQAAEEVARVFREARMRAISRGSAVLVHYVDATRSFEIREALIGPPVVNPAATCNRLPATSCFQTLNQWTSNENTSFGSQSIETYFFDEAAEKTGIKVFLGMPLSPTSKISEFSVCFSPFGRTYAVANVPPVFNSAAVLTYAPVFRVWRTEPGDTNRIGLERRVTLLPNGQTRLHSATGFTP